MKKNPCPLFARQNLFRSAAAPFEARSSLSRREFLTRTALASSAATLSATGALSGLAAEKSSPPIALFSKVCQELQLNFEDAATVTAEAGLNGIDCPVRPGGEVLPERVSEDLPRYAEVLGRRNLQLPLITTAILSPSSPRAEEILRTARKLGVQFYRLGFVNRQKDVPVEKQVREIKAQLKDLASLNKQIGLGAIFQNHSPAGKSAYVGGDLADLREIVGGFDPAQIGVAFDIGHALIVHGDAWREHFERLKSHLKIAYVKDARRNGRWVPFGQGDIASTGFFKLLKELSYHAPLSLHIEFDWSDQGKSRNRPALVKALKESTLTLKQWLAEA